MRPGIRAIALGRALAGAALSFALAAVIALGAAVSAPAAAPGRGLDSTLERLDPGRGASTSAGSAVLTLHGTDVASRITVFTDPASGELVLRDQAKVNPPGAPCTPDPGTPVTEVRCPPGYVGAIVGDLGGGGDRFSASRTLRVLIGAEVSGLSRPLRGGPGADRFAGGAVGDSLFGGPGNDELIGRRNPDLLNGGPGADRLTGGLGADGLFGAAGSDLLNGGPGRDFCNGGAGGDGFRSCALTR